MRVPPRRKASPEFRLEMLVQALNTAASEVGEDPALACVAALSLATRYAALLDVSDRTFLRHARRLLSESREDHDCLEEAIVH